jgi:hypothetical protein
LRHLVALSILLISLLAAGVPAFASGEAVPARDCCPKGPNSPCGPDRSQTPEPNRLNLCCTSSSTPSTAAAVAAPSQEFRKHWDHADVPLLLVVLSTLRTAYAAAPPVDEFSLVSRTFCSSTLYLSTGRLRL